MKKHGRGKLAAATAATLLMMPALRAADSWDDSSGDGKWATPTNWVDDTEPDGTEPCIFPDVIPGSAVITLSAGELAESLYLGNSYTLSGGSLILGGASGTGGANVTTPPPTFSSINSDLTGSAGLRKSQGGFLQLGGNNTFTGTVRVDGGTLRIDSDARLGDAANAVQLTDATLELLGSVTINRAITFNLSFNFTPELRSSGDGLTGAVVNSLGTLTVPTGGAINLSTAFANDELNIGSRTIAGPTPITGGANLGTIGINAAGVVRLGGQSCNYAGRWVVQSGTLDVGDDVRLGNNSNEVTLSGGTIVWDGSGSSLTLRPLTINSGAVRVNGPAQTLVGTLTINQNRSFDKVGLGTLRVFGPQSHSGGATINVNEGTMIFFSAAGNASIHRLRINVNAGGQFQANVTNFLSRLDVNHGGEALVAIETAGGGVLVVDQLVTAGSGRLDVMEHKFIVKSPVADVGSFNGSAYTGLTGLIASGRNGGAWDGPGIVTSQTAATTSSFTSVAIATAQQVKGLPTATNTAVWAGQTVTGGDALIMYTYGADANLDGKINVDDYGHIDSSIAIGLKGWVNGDFNYDGKINVDDYGIIDFNIGIQGPPFSTSAASGVLSAVPDPAGGAGLLTIATAGVLSRRRRAPIRRPPEKSIDFHIRRCTH